MRKVVWALSLLALVEARTALAGPPRDPNQQIEQIQQELDRLREENTKIHSQMESLQQKLGDLQKADATKTAELEQKVKAVHDSAPSRISEALDSYWGDHRFLVSGYGAAQYHWAGRGEENSFSAEIEPLLLYRVSDRLLFEAGLEFELPDDGETEANLEFAHFDYLLNDYATIVGGKYLLPFGDFYERVEPAWINKFVTSPLPFRHEVGLLPFNDVGAQIRGGVPLAAEGVDFEYTLYASNGPRFVSDKRGAAFEAFNNLDINKNKAVGARFGLRPLPFSWDMGRWKIGVSTYNGTWDDKNNLWMNTWGLDSTYQKGPVELRGEYVNILRELPGSGNEHREGWYVQAAYKLARLAIPVLDRSELVFRYAKQNQPQSRDEDPPSFLRGQQYSFGYDYWITPSTVWKLEYDYDDRKDERNNHGIFTQFAVGF